MEKLLDDLLTYSRAGSQRHPLEQVNTATLVQETLDLLAPPFGFTIHMPKAMPTLRTERVPLATIFLNLMNNTIRHHDRPNEGRLTITAEDKDAFIEFVIADNGPGIDPAFHERIFQLFQTLQPRDQREGSGMGLAIIKKLVESRGGTVNVTSTVGQGTTFRFTWPKQP